MDPRTPVIVGVGQVNYPKPYAPEPIELLADAARAAEADAAAGGLLAAVESIRIIRILSRRYPDPAALLADRIGADPKHRATTTVGGSHPQAMVNRTATEIAAGQLDVALIGGAEAWRTRSAYQKAEEDPNWSNQDHDAAPHDIYGVEKPFFHEAETAIGLDRPTQVYPIFETALRAKLGLGPDEHLRRIAELWSRFSDVAAVNPYAAVPRAHSAAEIASVSERNRMICYPYPKLMNSNNAVDQGAVLLMCSAGRARALGVDEDRWVFPVSGAEADDTSTTSTRGELAASPAIRVAGRVAFELAGVGADDVEFVDLYSCFPSAVQVAAAELGLSIDRQLTLTGGLTFAGGPWNNYTTHAVATLVPLLRGRPDATGLITANGGVLTKHAIGLYSGRPPRDGFRFQNVQSEVDTHPSREVAVGYRGSATVEAYTVEHDRESNPTRAVVAALTPDGARTWHAGTEHIESALAGDLVGREITVGQYPASM